MPTDEKCNTSILWIPRSIRRNMSGPMKLQFSNEALSEDRTLDNSKGPQD